MTTTIAIPETNEEGLTAVDRARAIAIVTVADYSSADLFCVGLKALEKKVDEAYDEHISAAFSAHRSLVAKKKKYAEPIEEARRIVKGKMLVFQQEAERLRKIEEDRINAEAKKKAEDAALADASAAEKSGDHEAAAAIISQPIVVAHRTSESFLPKAQTRVSSGRWGATVIDPLFVQRAIGDAGRVLAKLRTEEALEVSQLLRIAYSTVGYMEFNTSKLQKQADATKNAIHVGGVVFAPKA